MTKNTGKTGHLHSTTFHHARRNSGPLSVVIGVSSLNTMMHRTRLPVSSILSASLIIVVDVPSNLSKQTISLTRPRPHPQSYGPLKISGSFRQGSSSQKSLATNSVDWLRKWVHAAEPIAPCSSLEERWLHVCVDRNELCALSGASSWTSSYPGPPYPGLTFNKFVCRSTQASAATEPLCMTKATKMNKIRTLALTASPRQNRIRKSQKRRY